MSDRFPVPLPRMVAFTGPAGVGKDTIADRLVVEHGYHKQAFADPVRAACATALGIPRSWFVDRVLKERPIPGMEPLTPRQAMRTLGTDWGRNMVRSSLWIDRFDQRLLASGSPRVVVPDVRFNDEAEYIVSQGGVILELSRPGVSYKKDHETEVGIKGVYLSGVYEADTPEKLFELVLERLTRIGDTLGD